ncbi:MAG: hypothetical protein J5836_03230 [Clostridia bacterium]|nr:hypothetical protein [Clostridia bacterium]
MKRIDEELLGGAPHTAAADNVIGGMQSPYGKFKDLNALLRAYDSLESEFTRRSQRLKELEREAEERTIAGGNALAPDSSPGGTENAYETLIKRFPRAATFSKEFTAVSEDESQTETNMERTYIKILENEILKHENKLKDRDFLLGAVREDPTISEEVVNSYLKKLISSKPKAVFGGGKAMIAPPRRPNDLSEASAMAENYFNNRKFR